MTSYAGIEHLSEPLTLSRARTGPLPEYSLADRWLDDQPRPRTIDH